MQHAVKCTQQMKRLKVISALIASLFCSTAVAVDSNWVKCTETFITADYPTQECNNPNCPVVSTNDNIPAMNWLPDINTQWTRITVPNIADDAKAVYLVGLSVISNANPSVTAYMEVFFRAPGAPPRPTPGSWYDYPCQAVMAGYGGERSGCTVVVPVKNKQFDFAWFNAGVVPGVAYGFKFYVNAWCR